MNETEKLIEIIKEAVESGELIENPTDGKGRSFSIKISYGVFQKMSKALEEHKNKIRVS